VKRGFSLIEVMIALCILMISSLAFFLMHLVCIKARSYAECHTRAAVLGSSWMMHLDSMAAAAPELAEEWHQDPGNPIAECGRQYYRFWVVRQVAEGREATVYVAWDHSNRAGTLNFGSEGEIDASRCQKISFNEILVFGE